MGHRWRCSPERKAVVVLSVLLEKYDDTLQRMHLMHMELHLSTELLLTVINSLTVSYYMCALHIELHKAMCQ